MLGVIFNEFFFDKSEEVIKVLLVVIWWQISGEEMGRGRGLWGHMKGGSLMPDGKAW